MALAPLNPANYKSFVSGNQVCIVDFWAEWCGPCQIMAPVLDSLSEELTGAVAFGAVNVDEQPELAEGQGIMSIPTMVIYDDGIEVGRLIGMRSKESLRKILVKYVEDF